MWFVGRVREGVGPWVVSLVRNDGSSNVQLGLPNREIVVDYTRSGARVYPRRIGCASSRPTLRRTAQNH